MRGMPFSFEVPVDFFEKADAPEGKQKRIGGVISTETPDRQGETVLQNGLDFDDFVHNGWFNDNHSKDTDGVVGYPEYVKGFRKGDPLPSGQKAPSNCHWAEGYILPTERGKKIWDLGKALQGTGRRLGYSVEGKILRRAGPKTVLKKAQDEKGKITEKWVGNRVTKALVREVAITKCPVNLETGLDILAKSLEAVEGTEPDQMERLIEAIDRLEKALTMGERTDNTSPAGPKAGEGAGQVLARESLERDEEPPKELKEPAPKKAKEEEDEAQKSLSDSEAVGWIQKALPSLDTVSAGRIVELTKTLKRHRRL